MNFRIHLVVLEFVWEKRGIISTEVLMWRSLCFNAVNIVEAYLRHSRREVRTAEALDRRYAREARELQTRVLPAGYTRTGSLAEEQVPLV